MKDRAAYDSRRVTGVSGAPPTTQLELVNDARGHGYGFEVVGNHQLTDCWKLTAWYGLLQPRLKNVPFPPQSNDDPDRIEGSSPQNQVFLMSSWDLSHDVEFDLMARYVDRLETQSVPSYLSLDLRLGWRPLRDLELSIVGQNLLDSQHLEYGDRDGLPVPPVEMQRGSLRLHDVETLAAWRGYRA